jgi:hypothetical protein
MPSVMPGNRQFDVHVRVIQEHNAISEIFLKLMAYWNNLLVGCGW